MEPVAIHMLERTVFIRSMRSHLKTCGGEDSTLSLGQCRPVRRRGKERGGSPET